MNPWLNYHHLLYFKVIAEEGSLANASKKLLIGQPALSMQLKQLEETLGTELFDRKNKKLILTGSGKIVLEYARSIFRIGDELLDHLQDQSLPNRQRIQIGIHHSLPKNVIGRLTNFLFTQENPYLIIESGHTEQLMDHLLYHEFDLLVLPHPPLINERSLIQAKIILSSKVVICGHKKYKKLQKNFPKSIDGIPMILPSGATKLRNEIEYYFQENRLLLNVAAECQDTYLQKQMCMHGDGLIAIMEDAVKPYLKSQSLEILGTIPNIKDEVWIVAMKRKIQNPLTTIVFDQFKL